MGTRIKDWVRGLFPHDKPVRYILTAFVIVLLLAFGTKCHGAELVFEGGSQIIRSPSPALSLNVVSPRIIGDIDGECGLVLVGGRVEGPKTNGIMGVQCGLVDGFGPFEMGIGLVYFNHTDALNGSQLNFALKLHYRINERWGVGYRHYSNSGTTDVNTGRDLVLITYRFKP